MKITVDCTLFRETFRRYGRSDQFSREALSELFTYYDELDSSCGTETELDVIAICCDWTEYDDDDLMSDYGYLVDDGEFDSEDDLVAAIIEALRDRTTVIARCGSTLVELF